MDRSDAYNSPERLRVLLIDGDKCDRALFGLAAEASTGDTWVTTVESAEEGIAYIQGEGKYGDRLLHPWPDLVVIALRLPKMPGLKFLEWKKNSAAVHIPVLVFTNFAHPRDIEAARSLADDFIEKPLGLSSFEQAVARMLEFGRERQAQSSKRGAEGI